MADHDVADIKRALSDPTRVLEALGMMGQGKARQRQSGGWMIRCPVHVENSPSCSVQQKDGVILWRCWGCLPVDTSVLTPSGLRRLDSLAEGDLVYGSYGVGVTVIKTHMPRRERVLCVRTVADGRGLLATANHRMLVTDAPVTPHSLARQRWSGELFERVAGDLQSTDWLPFCIPEQSVPRWRIDLEHAPNSPSARKLITHVDGHDDDLAWAFGLYAAEGSSSSRCLTFSIHIDEVDKFLPRLRRVASMFGATASVRTWPDRKNSAEIRISSAVAADMFEKHCGSGAPNKRCPTELLLGPVRAAALWLLGLRDGDGNRETGLLKVTSPHLIDAAFVIAARCHAFPHRSLPSYQRDRLPAYILNFVAGSFVEVENATRKDWTPRPKLRKSEAIVQLRSGAWALCSKVTENAPAGERQVMDLTTSDGTFSTPTTTVHNCDERGDVLHLVAAAHGMKVEHDFKRILIEAARLGGLWHIVDKLEGREVPREAPAMPSPMQAPAAPPEPPREWPPQAEVDALWAACGRTANDPEVAAYLEGRAISPELVDELDLARVLPADGPIPWWAGYKGDADLRRPWRAIGYKLIVPMYSAIGVMRSVRAWRVIDVDIGPSRLPAGGHKAGELVMADAIGLAMLRGEDKPYFVTIVEGEPDFLSRAIVTSDAKTATIGIINGSWTKEFAERFPFAAKVAIRTDLDKAGDRYADQILATLRRRCFPRRLQA